MFSVSTLTAAQLNSGRVTITPGWPGLALSCQVTNDSTAKVTEQSSGTPVDIGLQGTIIAFAAPQSQVTFTCLPGSYAGNVTVTLYDTAQAPAAGTPNAPDVSITAGAVTISGTVNAAITSSVPIAIASGTVNIGNTPAVTIASGSVTANISGTPNINISSQSITVATLTQETVIATGLTGANVVHGPYSVPAGIHSLLVGNTVNSGTNQQVVIQGVQSGIFYAGTAGGGVATIPNGGLLVFDFSSGLDTQITVETLTLVSQVSVIGLPQPANLVQNGEFPLTVTPLNALGNPIAAASTYGGAFAFVATDALMTGLALTNGSNSTPAFNTATNLAGIILNTAGALALAADRPPDDWQATSAQGLNTTATATQASPGAGKRLITTGFYVIMSPAAGATAVAVAVSTPFGTMTITCPPAGATPFVLQMTGLRVKAAQAAAVSVSAPALANVFNSVGITGYTVAA